MAARRPWNWTSCRWSGYRVGTWSIDNDRTDTPKPEPKADSAGGIRPPSRIGSDVWDDDGGEEGGRPGDEGSRSHPLVGKTVRILDGVLRDFAGTVEAVDAEGSKVRVVASIFGRETPVELEVAQVKPF